MVLSILKLQSSLKFSRVLYIDVDIHHGDGVEEAFCMDPNVPICRRCCSAARVTVPR